jgi:sec-independent protein translocase protein TatA
LPDGILVSEVVKENDSAWKGEAMPRIGPWELALILGIVLIVFGVGKLPQVGGSIGKALREFRKGQKLDDESTQSDEKSTDEKSSGEKSSDEKPAEEKSKE